MKSERWSWCNISVNAKISKIKVKKENMPEKNDSMALSTVKTRRGVYPHLPHEKKGD